MMLSPDAVGVVSDSGRAQIVGNSIKGGLIGVLTAGESAGAGDLIQGNTVVGTDREGMLIANDSNVVVATPSAVPNGPGSRSKKAANTTGSAVTWPAKRTRSTKPGSATR